MTEEVRAREELNECPRAVCLGSGGARRGQRLAVGGRPQSPGSWPLWGTVLLPLNLLQGPDDSERLFLHNNPTCGHISASDPLISL